MARFYGPARQMTQVTQPVTRHDAPPDVAELAVLRAQLAAAEKLDAAQLQTIADQRKTLGGPPPH